MLLFIFGVAIVNLAVGYALAGGFNFAAILERLPQRRSPVPPADLEDDQPLTRPAKPTKITKPEVDPADPLAAGDGTTSEAKPTKADVLASLAGFRQQLSDVSAKMNGSKNDPERFKENASKLQVANHAYLEEAEVTLLQLDELTAAGDTEASATRDAVANGNTQIAEMSHEIDDLIEAGLDNETTREKLIAQTDTMNSAVAEVEEATAIESAPESTAGRPDPELLIEFSNSMKSIDDLFNRLETLLAAAGPDSVEYLAAIRVDPIADHEGDLPLEARLEAEVGQLAIEMIEGSQVYASGAPSMLLLEGDSLEKASERLERLRQQVEATTFNNSGEAIHATITCAVADARQSVSPDDVVKQLKQALEESARVGTNRTFHHDGTFPTPVPELSMSVPARTIEIG